MPEDSNGPAVAFNQNRDYKVHRLGVETPLWDDLYHRLLRIGWGPFFAVLILIYALINVSFALAYLSAPGSVAHLDNGDFLSSFAFSVETMSTIGYGFFYPQTNFAHVLVTLEAIVGMFFMAVLTGLVFAKFARPSARIVFSDRIVYTLFNGEPILTLRLGNVRANRVFEGRARLTLLRDETSLEGEKLKRLVDLKLVRDRTPIFALSWTLQHVIDRSSPLNGFAPEDFASRDWDFIATFTGLDQDMAQTIAATTTYSGNQVVRARKFVDMIHSSEGLRTIDYSKLNQIET